MHLETTPNWTHLLQYRWVDGAPSPQPLILHDHLQNSENFSHYDWKIQARRGYKFSCGILQDIKYFMTSMMILKQMILRHSNLGRDTCIYTYVYVIYIHTYTHMYIFFFFSSHSVLLTQVSSHYWPGYIYSVCVYIYMHSFSVPSKS